MAIISIRGQSDEAEFKEVTFTVTIKHDGEYIDFMRAIDNMQGTCVTLREKLRKFMGGQIDDGENKRG